MTFAEQIFASFIGTFFGFLFAIILYFITNNIKTKYQKKTLKKYLIRELEYDIMLLDGWIEEIDEVLHKITANDKSVFSYFKYTYFQRSFIQKAFFEGIMYSQLGNEDISNLNTILTRFDLGGEQSINSSVASWKNENSSQKDALNVFEFEKKTLKEFKKQIADLLKVFRPN